MKLINIILISMSSLILFLLIPSACITIIQTPMYLNDSTSSIIIDPSLQTFETIFQNYSSTSDSGGGGSGEDACDVGIVDASLEIFDYDLGYQETHTIDVSDWNTPAGDPVEYTPFQTAYVRMTLKNVGETEVTVSWPMDVFIDMIEPPDDPEEGHYGPIGFFYFPPSPVTLAPGEEYSGETSFMYDKYGFPNGVYEVTVTGDRPGLSLPCDVSKANNTLTTDINHSITVTGAGEVEDRIWLRAVSTLEANVDTLILFYDFDIPYLGGIDNYPWVNNAINNETDLNRYLNTNYLVLASYYPVYYSDDVSTYTDRNCHVRRYPPSGDGIPDNGDDREFYARVQISPKGYSRDMGHYQFCIQSGSSQDAFLCYDNIDVLADPVNLAPLQADGKGAQNIQVDGDLFGTSIADFSDFDWYRVVRP